MTDNRNRTVAEIRKIFEKNNGVLGGAATAGWAFERKGISTLAKPSATEDQLMEIAVGAGADDYADAGRRLAAHDPAAALEAVLEALEKAKIAVKGSKRRATSRRRRSRSSAATPRSP